MVRPRILLADDHRMLSEAFGRLLSADYEILDFVTNGRELIDSAKLHKPNIIIVDISMPLLNGIDAARQIKRDLPDIKIIFLTVNEDPELAAEAFRLGASGYVLKNCAVSELIQAIEQVLNGQTYVTPLITKGLLDSFSKGSNARGRAPTLTPRQREVLQLLAEGHSMKHAARILDISPRTVAFHKYRIMETLHIETNAELIHFAIKNDIASP